MRCEQDLAAPAGTGSATTSAVIAAAAAAPCSFVARLDSRLQILPSVIRQRALTASFGFQAAFSRRLTPDA